MGPRRGLQADQQAHSGLPLGRGPRGRRGSGWPVPTLWARATTARSPDRVPRRELRRRRRAAPSSAVGSRPCPGARGQASPRTGTATRWAPFSVLTRVVPAPRGGYQDPIPPPRCRAARACSTRGLEACPEHLSLEGATSHHLWGAQVSPGSACAGHLCAHARAECTSAHVCKRRRAAAGGRRQRGQEGEAPSPVPSSSTCRPAPRPREPVVLPGEVSRRGRAPSCLLPSPSGTFPKGHGSEVPLLPGQPMSPGCTGFPKADAQGLEDVPRKGSGETLRGLTGAPAASPLPAA